MTPPDDQLPAIIEPTAPPAPFARANAFRAGGPMVRIHTPSTGESAANPTPSIRVPISPLFRRCVSGGVQHGVNLCHSPGVRRSAPP
jgi:hypothetical protein